MANTAISNTIIQGAPANVSYVALGTSTDLINERVLTAGTGVTLTDGGAGSTLTISTTLAATQSDQETATSTTTYISPGRQQYHPSASKCWCVFDDSGSISASFNINSVTDNGTGDWTVNIGTDFSSGSYCATASAGAVTSAWPSVIPLTGGTCRVFMFDYTATPKDNGLNMFTAFGDQ